MKRCPDGSTRDSDSKKCIIHKCKKLYQHVDPETNKCGYPKCDVGYNRNNKTHKCTKTKAAKKKAKVKKAAAKKTKTNKKARK